MGRATAASRQADSDSARSLSAGARFRRDAIAGLTVSAIAVPQAMAYALIAGVDPKCGLYAAIVVTAVGSFFGSSSFLINGPTNAISLVVFSALAGVTSEAASSTAVLEALFVLAIMVGLLQIAIALFRLGDLTRYVSESVIIGFMAGAGLLIALTQIANILGLKDQGDGHMHLLYRLWLTVTQGGRVNPYSLGISVGVTVSVVVLRRIVRRYRLPRVDMLFVLIAAAALTHFMGWSTPDAVGHQMVAVVGNVPAGLPAPHIPELKLSWLQQMSGGAVAIALLGLLEALSIAKSLATQTRQSLDYNRQCLAEGLANLTGGFFQCMPGSGSLTRSAINFQAGAVSRWSGVYSAGATAAIMILFTPLAAYVPKAALGGILLVTAAGLLDWGRLRFAISTSRYDAILVLVTALTAIFVSVEYSVLIGTLLSFIMFVPRAARLHATELQVGAGRIVRERQAADEPCPNLAMFDLEGELFFGASPEFEELLDRLRERANQGVKIVLLRVRRARNPDMVCLKLLEQFVVDMRAKRVTVLLCGVREDFFKAMKNVGFDQLLPADCVFLQDATPGSSTIEAVRHAYELLGADLCETCPRRGEPAASGEPLYYMI